MVSPIVLVNAFFNLAREGNENGERGRRADFVEEAGEQFEIQRFAIDALAMASGWVEAWHRYELGQLSEVLDGCCEKDLTIRQIAELPNDQAST